MVTVEVFESEKPIKRMHRYSQEHSSVRQVYMQFNKGKPTAAFVPTFLLPWQIDVP